MIRGAARRHDNDGQRRYVRAGAKRGQRGRGNWARFAGVRVALILVVALLVRLRVLKGHGVGYVRDPVLWGVGLAIWVLGLGLAVWARIYLGRNWGMPMSTKEDPELVTSGPYRTIRHPIYTGILLAMIGSAIAVSVWWLIAVALIGGYFIYGAFVEEREYDQALPQCISGVPAVHENADPRYLLRTRGACWRVGPRPRCWPRGLCHYPEAARQSASRR